MSQRIDHYGNYHVIIETTDDTESTDNYIEVTILAPQRQTEDYLVSPNLQAFAEKPLTCEKLAALVALPNLAPVQNGRVYAEAGGQKLAFRQAGGISHDGEEPLFALLVRLIDAYPRIVSLGGAAVPSLHPLMNDESHPLQPFARQLLEEVAAETRRVLEPYPLDQLLCPACWVYFAEHELAGSLLESPLSYYGCRACSQSQAFEKWSGRIVAVLDTSMAEVETRAEEAIRVNWLHRRTLFDFETVEIIQADDEAVERLAMQIGNDTDPLRQARYLEMICAISPSCTLSENTLRILQRTFGNVRRDM